MDRFTGEAIERIAYAARVGDIAEVNTQLGYLAARDDGSLSYIIMQGRARADDERLPPMHDGYSQMADVIAQQKIGEARRDAVKRGKRR